MAVAAQCHRLADKAEQDVGMDVSVSTSSSVTTPNRIVVLQPGVSSRRTLSDQRGVGDHDGGRSDGRGCETPSVIGAAVSSSSTSSTTGNAHMRNTCSSQWRC